MPDFDLIVIGGGPAGMMAAARAGERGRRVLLLERGPSLGRKLLITAGGRCNVTNSAPLPEFLKRLRAAGRVPPRRDDPVRQRRIARMAARRGVQTVEERKGRVFPESQQAATVLDALRASLQAGAVEVRLNQRVESLWIENGILRGVSVAASDSALRNPALRSLATGVRTPHSIPPPSSSPPAA